MLNVIALASNVAADGNSAAVNFGPSSSAMPNNRVMPGETQAFAFLSDAAFDGTVAIEKAVDGTTWSAHMAAVDLTTGKNLIVELVVHEYMRLVVASRGAGSVSCYCLASS